MATLNKNDLCGIFGFLAVVFLLDSLGVGFLYGVILFIVMAFLVWFSGQKQGMHLLGRGMNGNAEILTRVAILVLLVGVFLQSFYIIALGIFIGMPLLFMQFDGLDVDLWNLSVSTRGTESKQVSAKRKR